MPARSSCRRCWPAPKHRGVTGDRVLAGIAAGAEIMCRMSLVAPQATHKACFHPTAVFGAPAAAVAASVTLGLPAAKIAQAIGIAGSLASGIIEYLADGSWTKRLHAGEAAQSGIRAALLAEAGFTGPATVLEGHHGFYRAFAPSKAPDFQPLLDGLGSRWVTGDNRIQAIRLRNHDATLYRLRDRTGAQRRTRG